MQITPNEIKLDRELSDLDKFAIGFAKSISNHTKYVIVSGYVSILLGRTRGSEDIDMLIPETNGKGWIKIYRALEKAGYQCINAAAQDSFSYLKDGIAVRFAPKGSPVPNMEILFAEEDVQKLALSTKMTAVVGKDRIFISNLELQIAYKEIILGSPKDMEDARHLRAILGKAINMKKLKEYEGVLHEKQ
ncbi:MAG: hypothetical protein WC613_06255 [Candidatus Aenigmatarchaeota archaeon]